MQSSFGKLMRPSRLIHKGTRAAASTRASTRATASTGLILRGLPDRWMSSQSRESSGADQESKNSGVTQTMPTSWIDPDELWDWDKIAPTDHPSTPETNARIN